MKKFEFRLEPLLNLKEQEKKNLQKELMSLRNKYQQTEQELEKYKLDKQGWQEELTAKQSAGINSKELVKYRNYIEYLIDEIEEVKLKLDYWQQEIKDCQERLTEKLQEKKKLSKLKEKEKEKHWADFLQEERKQSDEIATNNFNHKDDGADDTIL
ncbi:MAG: flagellar export protein FliJ [Bacillota bacterium]